MSWDTAWVVKFRERLERATNANDQEATDALCDELVARMRSTEDLYPDREARWILLTLRRNRRFDRMQQVADQLIQSGSRDFQVLRQYGQSQLDLNNVTAALAVLKEQLAATAGHWRENFEIRGLIGRAYKQLYVNGAGVRTSRQSEYLEDAIRAYFGVYQEDPQQLWHGINSVALLLRAERDGVILRGVYPDPQQIARNILELIERKGVQKRCRVWDEAAAIEACVALDRQEDALRWLARYLSHGEDEADAFEYASTHRQLEEVWQLDSFEGFGARLLQPLMAQILKRQGGSLEIPADRLDPSTLQENASDLRLEKILGKDSFKRLGWLDTALERAKSVARIENSATGDGVGTGFLVRGGDFAESLGDELFLLTNAHVLTDLPDVRGALTADNATVTFEAPKPRIDDRRVTEILWSSPPHELDGTLARLDPPVTDLPPSPLTPYRPTRGDSRVYAIGHPRGGKLSFSIHDNLLLDYDDRMMHYRTPTEGGSSGSPVFNDNWQLIALHHAGGFKVAKLNGKEGTYSANEGIWIQAIRTALQEKLT